MSNKVIKIAVAGAIFAVAIDYFLKPTVHHTLGIK